MSVSDWVRPDPITIRSDRVGTFVHTRFETEFFCCGWIDLGHPYFSYYKIMELFLSRKKKSNLVMIVKRFKEINYIKEGLDFRKEASCQLAIHQCQL